MEIRFGRAALTPSRTQRVLRTLREVAPEIQAIDSRFVHLLELREPLRAGGPLDDLLDYDDGDSGPIPVDLLVVPRPGTISPWSSKATDILHNAGLREVARVERGIAYHLPGLDPQNRHAVSALLHDRMTEAVLASTDEGVALFAQARRRKPPLAGSTCSSGGVAALTQRQHRAGAWPFPRRRDRVPRRATSSSWAATPAMPSS